MGALRVMRNRSPGRGSPTIVAAVPPSKDSSSARAAAGGGGGAPSALASRSTDRARGAAPTWRRLAHECYGRLAEHPTLTAAGIYAVLSLLMVGQGLLPGRTLSSSDGLWTLTPWASSKPPGVRPYGANFELADAVSVFQPFFQ